MRKLQQRRDYRHLICSAVTFVSLAFGFLFPNALPRLLESFRDIGTSLLFYFFQILNPENNPIPPTVTQLPSWQLAPDLWRPVTLLPASVEEFLEFWDAYLSLVFNEWNFKFYLMSVSDFLYYGSRVLLILMPFVVLLMLLISMGQDKTCTERGKKSPALVRFQKFLFRWIYPIVYWCKDFIEFLKENKTYYQSWLALWALYFNLYSIVLSFVAYYLYFISSWDILSLYTQLLKLQKDLTPVIRFLPGFAWLFLFLELYNRSSIDTAFQALEAAEQANRAVLNKGSIITSVYGEPGIGKTTMITSMALTGQVKLFDDAFSIMINRAMQFPNFPWQVFRDYVKYLIDKRLVCDIDQMKKWFKSRRWVYDSIVNTVQWKRFLRKHPELNRYTFTYDFIHYRSTFSDELKVVHLYDALESYAAAYMIFSVQTNLLFSNYSIRTDSLLKDIGNLLLRDNDFFNRDPELQEVYSQHSHIIDFDMIRLGRKIVEGNKKANGAPVGVYVITEIDKEFKNMNLLKETKINANETNQKNDLHDAALMMIRHGAVIDNKPFIILLADLQRPEAWGAGGRELGNVMFLPEKTQMVPVLPFFSFYWLTEGIFSLIKKKWDSFDADYQYRRSDETLPIYLTRNLIAALHNHYEKLRNLFGMQIVSIEIQSGRMDGEIRKDKFRWLAKKDWSNRNRTDCLNSVWEKPTPNTMYIDDFITYTATLATQEECAQQNSYFQNDIHKIKEINKE